MTEKRFTVKQLIKYLADFNPNAVIMNNINPSWVTGMEEEEIRDIDNEKLNALNVWLFDDDEEAKRVIDLLGLNEDNLNEKARERSKALSKLQKENEQLKEDLKRCRNWLNSDKYDYELTLAFIKNKGYSLKDVLEYEKELKE